MKHTVSITGSFVDFVPNPPAHLSLKADLMADGVSASAPGKPVQATLINASQITVSYESLPDGRAPTTIFLGLAVADTPFPFLVIASPNIIPPRRLVLSGDFCRSQPRPGGGLECGSRLLTPFGQTNRDVTGYVYGADGTGYTPITVHQLQDHSADVEFVADPSFHPTWVVLQTPKVNPSATATFAFIQAAPEVAMDSVYRLDGLDCDDLTANPKDPCKTPALPTLQSLSPGISQQVQLLSIHRNLLFTRVVGHAGELPSTLTVRLSDGRTFLARRLTLPADDQSLLSVAMNVMDQETVHRNFGAQIAEHYLAVKLDVINRSAKKLQFNKSAVWFDVDYRQSSGQYRPTGRQLISDGTVDLLHANPYFVSFSTAGKCSNPEDPKKPITHYMFGRQPGRMDCEVFRFGIEQNNRVSPENYKTILNSFDYSTERTDRILSSIELFGSILNTIASGVAVAQVHNLAFRSSAQIFAGSFLPGFRSVVQDLPGIDRLRANLVNDTFQEIVQLSANGQASTIVLLPRDAIFDVQGYQQYVVIERVLNVHIDPDVLNGVKDPPVPMNHVELGYTKDQVRQSLGEPPNVTTAAVDNTTTYLYPVGPYAKVIFNEHGQAVSWEPRGISDQLAAAPTLDAARAILAANKLSATTLTLLNKNTVLAGISGLDRALQFDPSAKHVEDYTLLYPAILLFIGQNRLALEAFLASKALPASTGKVYTAASSAAKDTILTYAMPDIKDGTILVTLKPDGTITHIDFGGSKPALP